MNAGTKSSICYFSCLLFTTWPAFGFAGLAANIRIQTQQQSLGGRSPAPENATARDSVRTFSIKVVNRGPRQNIMKPSRTASHTRKILPRSEAIARNRRLPGQSAAAKTDLVQPTSVTNAPSPDKSSPQSRKITLQINTIPLKTDVYVDDRFVGQSPVKMRVERGHSHVLQFVRKGYKEKIVIVDAVRLQTGKVFMVVETLRKE